MASSTDSVAIFAEGTFEEQILELVSYVVRNRSDEEKASLTAPFQNALKPVEGRKPVEEDEGRKKLILSKILQEIRGLGDGIDREVEGFFNLLFGHLFALYPPTSPDLKQILSSLLATLSASSSERLSVRFRVFSNLFNAVPRNSPLRYLVYQTILNVANEQEDVDALALSQSDVENWLAEWEISAEDKASFLKSIVDAYSKAEKPSISYEYSLLYVKTLPSSSSEYQSAALDLIVTALRLPTIFDFDPLFKLDAILSVKNHELFSLLQIFLNGGLEEYKRWEAGNGAVLEKYQLSATELDRKIRLLTLSAVAFKHVGQNLPYSKAAEVIKVDPSEVEKWAIDVIRAGLVWGKLSQTAQSLHIVRATPRTFEREQWQTLEKRLLAWKQGLADVLEVVASAKRQNVSVAA